MTKEEFLDCLRASLSGRVNEAIIRENIEYYNSYIVREMRKGTPETVVLEGLGDPRLLAKSIIGAEYNTSYDEEIYEENTEEKNVFHRFSKVECDSIKMKLIFFGVIFLMMALVLFVLVCVVYLLWWLLPVLLICGLVAALYRFLE